MTAEEVWADNQAMIKHLAGKYWRRYGIDYQQLYEEAHDGLAVAIMDGGFDPEAGASLTTWLYRCVNWTLLEFCTRGHRRLPIPCSTLGDEESQTLEPLQREIWIENLLKDLSEDAQFLVGLITNAPPEISGRVSVKTCAIGRKAVMWYLTERCHWSKDRIENVWQEVYECLP